MRIARTLPVEPDMLVVELAALFHVMAGRSHGASRVKSRTNVRR